MDMLFFLYEFYSLYVFPNPIKVPEHLLIYFKNNFFLPHSMKTKVPFEKSSELAEPYNHHSREKQKTQLRESTPVVSLVVLSAFFLKGLLSTKHPPYILSL